MSCFVALTINFTAFYQLNNDYIDDFLALMSLKYKKNIKSHIYWDLQKRKSPIEIIYRLLQYYQNCFFLRRHLTVNYRLGSQGWFGKQNK